MSDQLMGCLGIILVPIAWLLNFLLGTGAAILHVAAVYIVYLKHGIILGAVAMVLPVIASIWALWITISNGSWVYALMVGIWFVIVLLWVGMLFIAGWIEG